jgi:hypothetical protein
VKEQEFLALKQGEMSVLEHERRFHDLSLIAPHYVLTKEHMIKKLKDGFRQELRQGFIALQFKIVRELIEASQALYNNSDFLHHFLRLIENFQCNFYIIIIIIIIISAIISTGSPFNQSGTKLSTITTCLFGTTHQRHSIIISLIDFHQLLNIHNRE